MTAYSVIGCATVAVYFLVGDSAENPVPRASKLDLEMTETLEGEKGKRLRRGEMRLAGLEKIEGWDCCRPAAVFPEIAPPVFGDSNGRPTRVRSQSGLREGSQVG